MHFITSFLLKPNPLLIGKILRANPILGLLVICIQIASASFAQAQVHGRQWDKTLGGSGTDYSAVTLYTKDGGFLVAGSSDSDSTFDKSQSNRGAPGTYDYWMVKTDSIGGKLWDKRYGGSNNDILSSALQTADGGFLLAGYSNSAPDGDITQDSLGDFDYWVVKIDGSGNKLWDKRFGGKATDGILSASQTDDGGYLLAGITYSDKGGDLSEESWGLADYWIVKINSEGTRLWDKRFGGSSYDILYSAIQTGDGGFLLSGYTDSDAGGDISEPNKGFIGSSDYWVVKIDGNGNKLWDKRFGGDNFDNLRLAIQTLDGGFLLAGSSSSGIGGDKTEDSRGYSDYWIIKTDSAGNKLWDKRFGGESSDELSDIIETSDKGYLLAGNTYSNIGFDVSEGNRGMQFTSDYWIVRTDSAGNKLWDKRFGGDNYDNLSSAIQTEDEGFLLAGSSSSGKSGDKSQDSRGSSDFWLVKTYQVPPPAQPYFVMKDTTVTTCSGTFFDPGFTGFYPDSAQYIHTFLPAISGNKLRFVFSIFEFPPVEASPNADFLYIYDGPTISAPLIGIFSTATSAPDTIIATNAQGALTFRFVSDGFLTAPGWQADITCIDSAFVKPPFIASLWNKRFGGQAPDLMHTAIQTSDGGYLLGGTSESNTGEDKSEDTKGKVDYWVIKTDSNGTRLWDKTFGGLEIDFIKAVLETPDGGYLLAGDSYSPVSGDKTAQNHGPATGTAFNGDIWLVKIDKDGNKLWDKTIGGDNTEYINHMIQTRDGNYLIAGASVSGISGDKTQDSRGGFDYWIVKIDREGNKLWDKRFGGSNDEYMNFVMEGQGNRYLLAGASWSAMTGDKSESTRGGADYWVIQTDEYGNKLWDKRFGGSMGDYLNTGLPTSDGGYLLGGYSESGLGDDHTQNSRGSLDYWLVKIDITGNKQWDRRYGGSDFESLRSLIQSADGGYLLAGDSFSEISGDKTAPNKGVSDYWLVKTDQFGNKLWDKTFGGADNDQLRVAIPATGGSLLLAGLSFSGIGADKSEDNRGLGTPDYWIVKTTPEVYLPAPLLVNFQDKLSRTPQGWTKDYGLPFGEQNLGGTAYTFGWKNRSTAAPIDLSGNGRKRPAPSDVLLASLIHMQGDDVQNFRGTPIESYWEVAVENGAYQVSVSVGDGMNYTTADQENHSIQVEGVAAITGFVPQGGNGSLSRFAQATVRVTVTDGLLTLLADGGTNTKINYAIIQPLGSATPVQTQTAELQAAESQTTAGQAFPNPFSDQVSVRLLPEIEGNLFVTIQDMMGNVHYQTQLANQHPVISLDLTSVSLKTGIYIVDITAENGSRQVTRVVKK